MKNNNIVIVDYQLGNLFSVKHACLKVGLNPIISSDKNDLINAKAIILPGVGAFGDAMKNLEKLDLIAPLRDKVNTGIPLIGVCLGLQLLFEESEEYGINKGLGMIKGVIKRFPNLFNGRKIKVPNIGWNTIFHEDNNKWEGTLLSHIEQNSFMYFVHSFFAEPQNSKDVLATTDYNGIKYCSAIKKGNIYAFQFHPEKSSTNGLKIYENIKKIYYDSE